MIFAIANVSAQKNKNTYKRSYSCAKSKKPSIFSNNHNNQYYAVSKQQI